MKIPPVRTELFRAIGQTCREKDGRGQTDVYDEVNSCFFQFCKRA
jgi:hypothetical protein